MAVPAYTTDLADIFLDGGGTSWTNISGGRETDPETDDYFQGSSCWSHDPFSSGIEGGVYPSTQTIASGDVALFWLKCDVVATLATKASGGMQAVIGSSATAYKTWYVRGSDDYAAGGWVCVAIDPTVTQSFVTSPAPTTATSWFGARWNVPASGAAKGYPMKVDAMRQGRAELLINGGQSGSLATFAGMATENDLQANKWGLFEAQEGGAAGYRWKGLMSFGPTSLTEFTDSNISIFLENTEYVGASFNRIEINNASSIINWTKVSITALGTVSKGEFEMIDGATLTFTGCAFTDMSTFIFNKGTGVCTNSLSVFTRCGQVTSGGATFTGCNFDESTAAVALLCDTKAETELVTGTKFASDGTGHGLQIGNGTTVLTTQSITLTDLEFSSYDVADPGTVANKAIWVNSGSGGGTITLNISGGTGVVQNYHVRATNCTVVVVSSVPVVVTVTESDGTPIEGAAIYLKTTGGTEVLNGLTNSSGVLSGSYGGTTPASIDTDVSGVKHASSAIPYEYFTLGGQIISSGYSQTALLSED